MKPVYLSVIAALVFAGFAATAQAHVAQSQETQALPLCRDAEVGERCRTRSGEIRVRPAMRGDRSSEMPLESLSAAQLDRLAAGQAIGGRWECACSEGEGKCNPVVEDGALECFAPTSGGCTGTCGLGITVDTSGISQGQTQGPND